MRYFEVRGTDQITQAAMLADIMRHFHARQQLGRAVVICADPVELHAAASKQWLKLSRDLQRRRGAATNAVEILKYTYNITRMQQMHLVAETPHEQADAAVYFVRPDQLRLLPTDCLTVYVTFPLTEAVMARVQRELPANGLVVDYAGHFPKDETEAEDASGFLPKPELEGAVKAKWRQVSYYLMAYRVDMRTMEDPLARTDAMDDAIDGLLEDDQEFLVLARQFQRTLDLARPLRTISKAERNRYELFMILAHRVQTLSTSGFSAQFLSTYADDMFFLSDNLRPGELLTAAIVRHEQAGRMNLARALMRQEQLETNTGGLMNTAVAL